MGKLVGAAFVLVLAVAARADTLAEMHKRGTLRWGGDATGGAPYIIDQGQGKPPTGFEAELAEYLAGRLGLHSQFVPKDWAMLPQDLDRGDVDVILNGYEWSAERERKMASTVPYYVYKLQLLVGPHSDIKSWEDLHGKRVGVLSESAAERYVRDKFPDATILALGEEGTTGVMSLVRDGKQLDATVQDLPAALYYVRQRHGFEDLKFVDEPVEPGYYVIFVRRGETELRDRLNDALRQAQEDGTLKAIYDKYGLWNQDQKKLTEVANNWPPQGPAAGEGVGGYGWLLIRAAGWTVALAFASMPLAMLVGLLVAVGRLYGPRWLDWLLAGYVELLRGTPLMLQIFVLYYLLPHVHVYLDPFWAGVFGLAINYSAYEAENYRAGLLAIPRGQMEAALSLGMSTATALRRVIVPQAVRVVIPPVTNDFIALFKDTAVVSVVGVMELTGQFRGLMVKDPGRVVELGLMTALLYLLMSYPLSVVARRLERRFSRVTA